MILLIIIGVVGVVMFVVTVVSASYERETREQHIRRQVIEADRQVQQEYRNARHAMNIAAGQAWRNMTG